MKKILTALICSAISLSAFAGGNIDAGKALAEKYSCAACHGKDLGSPIDPSYPKLAGQHKDYLEHALTAYKRGDAPNGRNNAIMTGQVKPLTNQDIKDLAAYMHSLPTGLVLHR
ncbi:cytochrome c553 [Janthinobacterium sp. CG_23.3]|uniref:c-type cytochrome n=1 Tax=unclassified Janthinobacterium TaxID=2610881 RepID=UPI000346E5CC|nr:MULTISPECIES: cytochrome c [unclassified Janthinobacterium]MEC5159586.1 cytochrome c553 [Janthinobacterium sp. CG_S6]